MEDSYFFLSVNRVNLFKGHAGWVQLQARSLLMKHSGRRRVNDSADQSLHLC